jgi:hypothetical protein
MYTSLCVKTSGSANDIVWANATGKHSDKTRTIRQSLLAEVRDQNILNPFASY